MSDLSRINLQHLLYLQALVEERHVTRAADRMGIGQPAMSAALARLRVVFRDVLLVKTTSGMEPTARALEIVRRIREIAELLEGRGLSEEHFDPANAHMHWKMMSSDGISRLVLPDLIDLLDKQAPRMRVTVHPGDPRRIAEYLRDGDFDLVLGSFRVPPVELRQAQLYPQRLVCIARRDHPQIHDNLSLDQFDQAEHVRWGAPPVVHATMETMVDEALDLLGRSRRIKLLVSSLLLLPEIVASSDLIAVVPEKMALGARDRLTLQVLTLPFEVSSVDVSMLWHDRQHQDPAHKWLRDALRKVSQKQLSKPE